MLGYVENEDLQEPFTVENLAIEGEPIEVEETIKLTYEHIGEPEPEQVFSPEVKPEPKPSQRGASPVTPPNSKTPMPKTTKVEDDYPKGKPILNGGITDPQLKKIMATKTTWKTTRPELSKSLEEWFELKHGDKSHKLLTKQEASNMIEYIEYLKQGEIK